MHAYCAAKAAVGSGGGISGAFSPQPLNSTAAKISSQRVTLFIWPPSIAP
jgi:hypothetical protein